MEKTLDLIDAIAYEKGLDTQIILNIIKNRLIKIAQEEINPSYNYFVETNLKERTLELFYKMIVCEDSAQLDENTINTHIPLSKALQYGDVNIGDEIDCEISLDSMNRGAINKVFLDIEYQIQKSLENQMLDSLKSQIGKIISGQVIRIDDKENTIIEIDNIPAVLPQKNRIKGENFKVGDTIKAILKYVNFNKNGLYIELSRTTPKFLEELLRLEVPEIKDNEVIIHKTARIPGDRAKVAVYSNNPRIDPIGCCVGVKGVRINAVSKELNGESIDCIAFHNTKELFIAKALTPAQVVSVKLEKNTPDSNIQADTKSNAESIEESSIDSSIKPVESKPKAIVTIHPEQKSKAIGKNGVNIRLASMLCECDIVLNETKPLIDSNENAESSSAKNGLDALQSLFK